MASKRLMKMIYMPTVDLGPFFDTQLLMINIQYILENFSITCRQTHILERKKKQPQMLAA